MGMTIKAAARAAGVTRQALYDRLRKGTLRRLPDGTLDEADVQRLAAAADPKRAEHARRGAERRKRDLAATMPPPADDVLEDNELEDNALEDLADDVLDPEAEAELAAELDADAEAWARQARKKFLRDLGQPRPPTVEAPTRPTAPTPPAQTVADFRARRERAEAELAEIRAAEVRASLVDADAAQAARAELADQIHKAFARMGAKVGKRIAAETNARRCGELLLAAIDAVLVRLADQADALDGDNAPEGDLADVDPTDFTARREKAKAELAELDLGRGRGALVDRQAAERQAAEDGSLVRDRLRQLGNRLRDRLAAIADPKEAAELVDLEIGRALEVLEVAA